MKSYIVQRNPLRIPTKDAKTILEHFGIPSTNTSDFSFAYMIAPPGWSEPFQKPEFNELTFIIRGKKQIEINDEKIILHQGESILVKKGTRVRYSNPFDEPVEYVSVCIPAFSIENVNRESD
ncbi:MAG: cupin domain-containing protein [Ignavibacteria bacterium]